MSTKTKHQTAGGCGGKPTELIKIQMWSPDLQMIKLYKSSGCRQLYCFNNLRTDNAPFHQFPNIFRLQ